MGKAVDRELHTVCGFQSAWLRPMFTPAGNSGLAAEEWRTRLAEREAGEEGRPVDLPLVMAEEAVHRLRRLKGTLQETGVGGRPLVQG